MKSRTTYKKVVSRKHREMYRINSAEVRGLCEEEHRAKRVYRNKERARVDHRMKEYCRKTKENEKIKVKRKMQLCTRST